MCLHKRSSKIRPALVHHPDGSPYSTLPIEIKRLIVEKVAEERFEALEVNSGWSRPTKSMRLVALVCRELAALMEPHLWKIVVLSQPYQRLVYFVDHILPRHGDHIRLLGIAQYNLLPDLAYQMRLLGRWQSDDDRQPAILSRAISFMPKVTTILYHLNGLPDETIYRRGTHSCLFAILKKREPENEIPLALVALGDRLEVLTLNGGRRDALADRNVAAFLSHFPSLTYLSITCPVWVEDDDQSGLVPIIASLRHLTFLNVQFEMVDPDAFTNAAWTCPLRTLSWMPDPSIPFPSFATFFAHFSSTLTTLHLTMHFYPAASDNVISPLSGPPFPLPHLHTLDLHTKYPDHLLNFFSLCPLRFLEIGQCPHISFDAWAVFITSHAGTLRRVTCTAASLSSQELERFRALCEANGISF